MVVPNMQQQLWQGVRRAWRRIARAGGIAAIAGIVVGEILGAFFNGGHNTFFIHLISLVLAVVMAYGAVVTVGIFQAIRGVFTAVGDLETQVRSTLGNDLGRVVDSDRHER
jgi:hypothetical protein